MTRDEVLEKLNTLGINISGETLRRWVNACLVPTPKRGNKGRAGGRWSEYPPETPWEAFAAWHLLKNNSINQVARTRSYALHFIGEICDSELRELNEELKTWQKQNTIIYEKEENGVITAIHEEFPPAEEFVKNGKILYEDDLIFEWLILRIKAEHAIDILIPIKVYIDYHGALDEDRWGVSDEPLLGTLSSDTEELPFFLVSWQIKNVQKHTDDEIVIEDIDTKAKIVLRTRKRPIRR